MCHAFNGYDGERAGKASASRRKSENCGKLEKESSEAEKLSPSHAGATGNLCIRNIVLREFMFMADYNENDYLYLPES